MAGHLCSPPYASRFVLLFDSRSVSGYVNPGLVMWNAGTYVTDTNGNGSAANWPTGVWNHIAIVRSSGIMKLYRNGTQIGGTIATAVANNSLFIGSNPEAFTSEASPSVNAYFDEFRSSNVARWTTNFTPPTAPYTED